MLRSILVPSLDLSDLWAYIASERLCYMHNVDTGEKGHRGWREKQIKRDGDGREHGGFGGGEKDPIGLSGEQ